jgi:hypothetical protein
MLNRDQVFKLIETERAYQDKTYEPTAVLSTGVTREMRDRDVTSGLTMLSSYVRKAEDKWTGMKGDSLPSLQEVGKIAAIAVRILERSGDSERLLAEGLR